MRRLVPVLVAIVAVVAAAGAMTGTGSGGGVPLALLVPVAVAALVWARHSARVGGFELRWAARANGEEVPATRVGGELPIRSIPAVVRAPASRRQVASALARVESRLWLASPWFGAGVGFLVVQAWLFGWVWAADYDSSWREWFVLMPIVVHPMVGMAVVGAHHAVTRGRRDGVDELFTACPADEAIRSSAQLLAGWVPAAVIVGFAVGSSVMFASHNPLIYGPIDGRAVADVVAAFVLGACGTALGVALARWAPWRLAPIVAVAALVPVIVTLGNIGEPHWSNARQLSTWPRYPDHDLLFTNPPVWWHVLWLGVLGALMVWAALVHATRKRSMVLAGVAVAVVAAIAGVVQTRPLSASAAARLASMVAEPERHQTCQSAGRVEVCVFNGYEELGEQVLEHVAPVATATPDSNRPVTMRQVFDGDTDRLGPEVANALAERSIPPIGSLALGFLSRDEAMVAARLTVALDAVGLPTASRPGAVPMVIAGEARGVVALWLAARGLDGEKALALASDHSEDPATALERGMAWPDPCLAGSSPPVAWASQDLAAARGLLALPADDVHSMILGDWERFVDPATTTDELLAAVRLEAVGPPDHVVAAPVVCDW